MLGIKRSGGKSKVHPDAAAGEGPASIADAYSELSSEAFACWMRLQVEPPELLGKGLLLIATVLGMSERRFQDILRELKLKGYMKTVGHGTRSAPALLVIERPALIQRTDRFVKLANVLQPTYPSSETTSPSAHKSNTTTVEPTYPPTVHQGPTRTGNSLCEDLAERTSVQQIHETLESIAKSVRQQAAKVNSMPRCKFVDESQYASRARGAPSGQEKSLLRRLKERQKEIRGRSLAERSEALQRREARREQAIASGRDPDEPDWSKLDHHGAPAITFEPGSPAHRKIIRVLERNPRDRLRKRMIAKIGTEFGKIYTRYRRDHERLTRGNAGYVITEGDKRHAAAAGQWCILKCVTPRQVLEYWHGHIGNFTDLTVVPLNFLASASNIDRVACAGISGKKAQSKPTTRPAEVRVRPAGGNSFDDKGELDERLRARLEEAGFQTQMYNDRYLLSIQHSAVSLAAGKHIFVGEGKMKAMILWAAENLYAKRS